MQASFKVQFNGKFRRFSLEEITFEGLVKEISKKFGLGRSAVTVSYLDEEGDRINIGSSFDLNEAIQYALPATCLKLLAEVPSENVQDVPVNEPQLAQQANVVEPIVQETPKVLIDEPQVVQEEDLQLPSVQVEEVSTSEPQTVHEEATEELIKNADKKKILRKQRSQAKRQKKIQQRRTQRALKREKTLKRREAKKNKNIAAKTPRSIKNKKVRGPRPFMARVITHVNFPTGHEIAPDVDFVKVWKLRNTGTLAWTPEFKIVQVSKNENGFAYEAVVLDREISPGNDHEIHISLRAPNQPGTYESSWRLVNSEGKRFGQRFSCKLVVVDNTDASTVQDQEQDPVNERKARSIERKQQRAEKFAKYSAQLDQIKSLGIKTTARHVRLLEKFDGNVDQVVAFIATKKAAKLA